MAISRLSVFELKGAPLSILAVLVEAVLLGEASALTTNQLVDRTGYKSLSVVAAALRKLADHGYVVSPGTLGRGGQLYWALSTEFPTLFDLPEGGLNLEHITTLQIKNVASPMYGVVVKDSINSLIQTQHHTEPTLQIKSVASLPEFADRARSLLERLNCWPNITQAVLESLHPEKGLAHLLGWIAYAHDPANQIRKPAAVIAANLRNGLYPTTLYLPPNICRTCGRADGHCGCVESDPHLPDSFDDLAFQAPPEKAWGEDAPPLRWYCSTCFAHPCQCDND